jgi:5'-deoxynucleotidase YfbR-like HD superfamily hydrolase
MGAPALRRQPEPAAPSVPVAPIAPSALKGLLLELNDLKRIRSAGRDGSVAARLFRSAWAALVAGERGDDVAFRVTAAAVAAARLGDLSFGALQDLGLSAEEARAVLRASFDEVSDAVAEPLRSDLRSALGTAGREPVAVPAFVAALEAQPRAGVTCPGQPRIILEPPENHAEHCLLVAVYGALLAPAYDADPATVFVAGLAHHLHNAAMPDSGFTGEMLLGAHLAPAIERATERALDELDPGLRADIVAARRILPDASTPEGRAFHAADVIDRVGQIAQHLQAASLTMDRVLGDMELVHDGPVKGFHDRVLREMDLP